MYDAAAATNAGGTHFYYQRPQREASWCSRMVIVQKSSGEPQRTVDFKALNDALVRQTHNTKRHGQECPGYM